MYNKIGLKFYSKDSSMAYESQNQAFLWKSVNIALNSITSHLSLDWILFAGSVLLADFHPCLNFMSDLRLFLGQLMQGHLKYQWQGSLHALGKTKMDLEKLN